MGSERKEAVETAPSARSVWSRLPLFMLLISIIMAFSVIFHDFFRYVDRTPYLAVDDGLGNISVGISNLGRYGFQASPIQGLTGDDRSKVFLNYGPVPFYLGALLDWLFGSSYVVQRSWHPLALTILACIALISFRGYSLAAGGFFALLTVSMFSLLHWPMVRPDITVAFLAGCLIACSTWAIRTSTSLAWLAVGFCAVCTASTHQIAWAVIPASVMIWLIGGRRMRSDSVENEGVGSRSGLALLSGMALAGVVFLAAINFQVGRLVRLWLGYAQATGSGISESFFSVIMKHASTAWSGLPAWLVFMVASACVAAAVMLAMARRFAPPIQRQAVALLLPPLAIAVCYQLSVGIYNNYHAGYTLLSHVATAWTVAAVAAAGAIVLSYRWSVFRHWSEQILRMLAAVLLVGWSWSDIHYGSRWEPAAKAQVSIDDYLHECLDILPRRATAWGDIKFGLESGVRVDLIQFAEGIQLAKAIAADKRDELAPDYLLMNTMLQDWTHNVVKFPSDRANPLTYVRKIFPHAAYRLHALIDAPPYGTTRVYSRRADGRLPWSVAAYDPAVDQWSRQSSERQAQFVPAEPATLETTFLGTAKRMATRTMGGELPAGCYQIIVRVESSSREAEGLLVASSTDHISVRGGDLGFSVAQAFYCQAFESDVALIVQHIGGRLFISQFDETPGSSFRVLETRQLIWAEREKQPLEIPPLSQWTLAAKGQIAIDQTAAEVTGDDSRFGYQLISPAIRIAPHHFYELDMPPIAIEGNVGLGVLNGKQSAWITNSSSGRFQFDSGMEETVFIVVYNDNAEERPTPTKFRIKPGSFSLLGQSVDANKTYVDRLIDGARDFPLSPTPPNR